MTRLLRLAATIIALSILGTLSGFAQANLEKLCDHLADNPPAGVKLVSIIEHRNPESKKLERRTMLFEVEHSSPTAKEIRNAFLSDRKKSTQFSISEDNIFSDFNKKGLRSTYTLYPDGRILIFSASQFFE